ncbi:hypothetical protein SteCoe_4706 [Stentor coeruleus]|uniref:Uncharacterized protein n=1 Tax=Stentor coeruleus TaxID=5963 RepID=A0A1R2CU86_9CILI|nr:hypothetical protein SteCoe_4706 [Stentor coeruleus]
MNLKLEIMLLILGGVIKIVSVSVNLWYFLTQKFAKEYIMLLCGTFLIAPSAVLLLLTIALSLVDVFKGKFGKVHFKLGLGLMITIGGPIGIPMFVYAGILAYSETHTGDFYIIEAISRSTSLVEALFGSLPQIAIQFYNNVQLQSWETLQILSITISVVSLIYTGYKLCFAVDKIQQYEMASAKIKPESPVADLKTLTERRIEIDLQVHDVDEHQ